MTEGGNRTKCVLVAIRSIEMKCIMVTFPTYVTGSSLAEIVRIGNPRISNPNDVDRGSNSNCEVRWAGKTQHRN